jgi:DNA-binding transcriptional ArsR family regulator
MSNIREAPFASEEETYHFLTQETRYLILQYVLAHPENLPSLDELDHAIPKGKSTIHEHLGKLRERDMVDSYEIDTEERTRDLPSTFYGLTAYGIHLLEEFDLLQGKPTLQAMYANMEKPERIQRYEDAPRPSKQSGEELRAELDGIVRDNKMADTTAARKATGISNLLNGSGDDTDQAVDYDASVRLEIGSNVLRLLESDDSGDRAAAVSAVSEIADASPESVVPVLPTLADTIDSLCLERQRELSAIFETVASDSPDEIPDDAIERLTEFYSKDIDYWQQDTEVAQEALESGLSIAECVEAPKLRVACHVALGEIALRGNDYDVATAHFETVLDSDGLSRVTNAVSPSLEGTVASMLS